MRARRAREGTALFAACVSLSACTHLEYTRSIESGDALIREGPVVAPAQAAPVGSSQRISLRW